MSAFIGEIIFFAGDFEPEGWLICDGRKLPVTSHSALYSIIGTTYGGDGQVEFALPDLRGRVQIGQGTPLGGSPYPIGKRGGVESFTLTEHQMPRHTHDCPLSNIKGGLRASTIRGTRDTPFPECQINATEAPGQNDEANIFMPPDSGPTVPMGGLHLHSQGGPDTTATGDSQPQTNMMPFLAVNALICEDGAYPSRQ